MASRSGTRPSARAAVGNLATKVVLYPLAFIASLVVDRALGPHDRGLYSFLLLVGSFMLPLMTFGFGGAVIYFISSGKRTAEDVSVTTLLFGLVVGLLSAAVTYSLWRAGWLGETGRETPRRELLVMLALVPFQGVQLMASRVLFGESRFGTSNWLALARSTLNPLLLLILVVAAGMGLWGAVIATATLNVGFTVATVVTLRPQRLRYRYDHGFLVEGLRYGIKMWVGELATRANLRLDQMLLGIFAPASALGTYSVAVRLSEFLWVGPDAVAPVLFNRLAATKDKAARIALTARIHRLGLAALVLVALVAGIGGWWLVPLILGAQFAGSIPLFEMLLVGTVAMYTAKVLTKYFAAVGAPELSGRLGLYSGVAGAALYFALIPLGATTGAAIASSLSYLLMSAVALRMYSRLIAPDRGRLFALRTADFQWLAGQLGGRLRRRSGKVKNEPVDP